MNSIYQLVRLVSSGSSLRTGLPVTTQWLLFVTCTIRQFTSSHSLLSFTSPLLSHLFLRTPRPNSSSTHQAHTRNSSLWIRSWISSTFTIGTYQDPLLLRFISFLGHVSRISPLWGIHKFLVVPRVVPTSLRSFLLSLVYSGLSTTSELPPLPQNFRHYDSTPSRIHLSHPWNQ